MLRSILGSAVALALAAGAAPASAQSDAGLDTRVAALVGRPGGLTAEQVARRALATSPDLRARDHELEAAAAAVDEALVAYFPRLTATARYTRLSEIDQGSAGNVVVAPPGTPEGVFPTPPALINAPFSFPSLLNQYLLQGTLAVPVSDYLLRTSQRYGAAQSSKRAVDLQAQAARLELATNAKLAYYGWVRARLQQLVAEQSLEQTKAHLEVARATLDAKLIARVDVLRVESQVSNAELLAERAASLADSAEHRLRTMMHDPPGTHYSIGEDLQPPADSARRESPEVLHAEALRKRPELRALEHTQWSLSKQSDAAHGAAWPRLDAFANAYYSNPNQRVFPQKDEFRFSWDAGVQLTWTPNEAAAAAASARAVEAKRAVVQAQRDALSDALGVEVHEASRQLREARAALRTTQRGLIAAEEQERVRTEQLRAGDATGVELTDAETEVLRARLELINARIDLLMARTRLEHATGRDAATTR